jgi:hypothetical protein
MDEENSNPETGELSDDDAVRALAAAREAGATEEAEPEEAEEAESEEAEETGPEEEVEEEPVKFTVKIDGLDVEVTQDELLNGYQRDADYRRKTQALAEERREIAAEKTRQKDITANLLSELQKVAGNDAQEPDWVKLSVDDPLEFIKQRAAWDSSQAQKERARHETARLVNQQRAEIEAAEIAKLRDKVPEWRDPEAFMKEFTSIESEAVKTYGFSAEEMRNLVDHRALLVLRDAAKYRAMQVKQSVVEKKVAAAPKAVVKPGSPAQKASLDTRELEAARNKIRTGGDDAAVRYLQMKRSR